MYILEVVEAKKYNGSIYPVDSQSQSADTKLVDTI